MSYDNVEEYRVKTSDRLRPVPQSDLDYQLMTTDTQWGDWSVSEELREKLGEAKVFQDVNGNKFVDIDSLWGLLSFYTRDMRLGNLPNWSNEVFLVEEHINYAGDCIVGLQIKPPKVDSKFKYAKQIHFSASFLKILKQAITKLEVSQSRGGFLRRRLGTLTQENFTSEMPKKKKGILQGKGGYE